MLLFINTYFLKIINFKIGVFDIDDVDLDEFLGETSSKKKKDDDFSDFIAQSSTKAGAKKKVFLSSLFVISFLFDIKLGILG